MLICLIMLFYPFNPLCFWVYLGGLVQIGSSVEPDIYAVLKNDHEVLLVMFIMKGAPCDRNPKPCSGLDEAPCLTRVRSTATIPIQQSSSCTMIYVCTVIDRKTSRKIQIVLLNGLYSCALGEADVGTLFSFPVHCLCEINCSFRAMSEWRAASL